MPSSIEVVLLDLGGVLLRLHDPLQAFGMDMEHAEFMETWLLSPSVREFERGKLRTEQFVPAIISEFGLSYSPAEFIRRLESWPDALYDGALELLKSIRKNHQVALLSNTNEVHWSRKDIADPVTLLMDKVFISYQTGYLKPEQQAYTDVLDHFDIDPGAFLFLDDNPLNIEAARQCGMQATLTRGFESLQHNLRQARVI